MKVKVYLTSIGDRSVLNDRKELDLPEGATLGTALRKLKIPRLAGHLPLISINSKQASPKVMLSEGDIITFFGVHVGG